MKIRLIRHATLWIEYAGVKLLVDPMFSGTGANPPIALTPNRRRNPLVPLTVPIEEINRPDAVLVTHLHRDHWDETAREALDPDVAVFCQPGDEQALESAGLRSVEPVGVSSVFRGITLIRTGGRHGCGRTGERMGRVSGFVLRAPGEPTLYIAGDTVWCAEVKAALDNHRPDWTVVNAGGARFIVGAPITMTAGDVARVMEAAPYTRVAAVHMDAVNHCLVTREILGRLLEPQLRTGRLVIPGDGEWFPFSEAYGDG